MARHLRRLLTFAGFALLAACGGSGPSLERLALALGLPGYVVPVCGDDRILGREVGDLDGPGRCGIEDAVAVYAVSGVAVEPAAQLNCTAARALLAWTEGAAKPAARAAGSDLVGMSKAASYACRSRNHRRGARLSEHSFGNAIDLKAFTFANGEIATVQGDYRSGGYSRLMKRLHGAACGPFGTVLGPDADRYHQDHFHFDVANHRSGPYCR